MPAIVYLFFFIGNCAPDYCRADCIATDNPRCIGSQTACCRLIVYDPLYVNGGAVSMLYLYL
jgi:hypothetical protein